MNKEKEDTIYKTPLKHIAPFKFDKQTAQVFENMVTRSVPGYQQNLQLIQLISHKYFPSKGTAYDLGCATGLASISALQAFPTNLEQRQIYAVDSSADMLQKARENITQLSLSKHIELIQDDICSMTYKPCDIVILNLTLQFIKTENRDALIQNIYHALNNKGVLILCEKLTSNSLDEQELWDNLHHSYKFLQAYSELEMSQKRQALENVLIPESHSMHTQRLKAVGFEKVYTLSQHLNFTTFLAIKT